MWPCGPRAKTGLTRKSILHSCRYESGKGESHDITLSFLSLLCLYTLKRTFRNLSLDCRGRGMSITLDHTHYPSLHPTRQQLVIGHIMLAPCLVTSKASRELHPVSSPGLLPRSKTVTTTDLLYNSTIQIHIISSRRPIAPLASSSSRVLTLASNFFQVSRSDNPTIITVRSLSSNFFVELGPMSSTCSTTPNISW